SPAGPVTSTGGGDRRKITTALSRLRSHFATEAIESVSALDTPGDETVALCNAGSLFGDSRLIVVRDVDGQKDGEGRLKGGWKAADVAAGSDHPAEPAPPAGRALGGEAPQSSPGWGEGCAKGGAGLP